MLSVGVVGSVSVDPALAKPSAIQRTVGGPARTPSTSATMSIEIRRMRRRFFICRRCSAARRAAGDGSPARGLTGSTPYDAFAAGFGRRGGNDIDAAASLPKLDGGVLEGAGSAGAAGSGGSVGRPVMAPSSLPLTLISVESMFVYRGWQGMA